jgi:hypothetical protein
MLQNIGEQGSNTGSISNQNDGRRVSDCESRIGDYKVGLTRRQTGYETARCIFWSAQLWAAGAHVHLVTIASNLRDSASETIG